MNRNINKNVYDLAFKNYSEVLWASFKKTNSKGANYRPSWNVGKTTTLQNPLPFQAIVSNRIPWALQQGEIGLISYGAISLIIREQDVNLIKFAQKITYNEEDYSPRTKVLGNQVIIRPKGLGFYSVVLYRLGNKENTNS